MTNNLKSLETARLPEYKLATIINSYSPDTYGIAAYIPDTPDEIIVREIGSDKPLVLSVIEILNDYKIPLVHFGDVIDDIIYE